MSDFEIRRVIAGYAYPRNGNVHNPTPRYRYEILKDGRVIGSEYTHKAAREFVEYVLDNPDDH